jgi:hypothetical protein
VFCFLGCRGSIFDIEREIMDARGRGFLCGIGLGGGSLFRAALARGEGWTSEGLDVQDSLGKKGGSCSWSDVLTT